MKDVLFLKCKNLNIQHLDIPIYSDDLIIYDFLLTHYKNDHVFNLYNFVIILKYCYDNLIFQPLNKIEKLLYVKNDITLIQLKMVEFLSKILSSFINDMIKVDIDIRCVETPWVCISLDSLYRLDLGLNLTNEELSLIMPKTKNFLIASKKINQFVLTCTLCRYKKIIFYSKMSNDGIVYSQNLIDKIKFTKGILVCLEPDIVKVLKNLRYIKKIVLFKPKYVEFLGRKNVYDFINPLLYNHSIWIHKYNIPQLIENVDSKLFLSFFHEKNILMSYFDSKDIINIINFLNSIAVSYNFDIWNVLIEISLHSPTLSKNIISKNELKESIYMITNNDSNIYIEDSIDNKLDINLQKISNNTAIFEVEKWQIETFKKYNNGLFFLDYKCDSRMRLYCNNFPINYQLNHLSRVCIKTLIVYDISIIYKNFFKLPVIIENLYNVEIFIYKKYYTILFENFLLKFFPDIKFSLNDYLNCAKIESVFLSIINLSPKNLINLDKKLIFGMENYYSFINANLIVEWEFWCQKLNRNTDEMPYIVLFQNTLKKLSNNNFESMHWCDASSNALQLITFRQKIKNKTLLKLTNIINNDTGIYNIYAYITKTISETDHSEIIKDLSITLIDFISLQNDSDNKHRAMTACYGATRYGNIEYMEKTLSQDSREPVWSRIGFDNKTKIANYFWKLTFKILKEIDFDIENYKKLCLIDKNEIITWFNDFGLPIIPLKLKTSQRQKYIKKLNNLKYRESISYDHNKIILTKRIESYKKRLNIDDKTYWKRMRVDMRNKIRTLRVYNEPGIIDFQKMKTSVTPNSIHSYDSSVMCLCISICKDLGIHIMVIHDSIGVSISLMPIVKIIFKISNIILLKKAKNNPPFPYKTCTIINYDINFFIEILKSENFFR